MGDNHNLEIDARLYRNHLTDQKHEENPPDGTVGAELAGARLDQALASLFRTFRAAACRPGPARAGSASTASSVGPRDKVEIGDRVRLRAVTRIRSPVCRRTSR